MHENYNTAIWNILIVASADIFVMMPETFCYAQYLSYDFFTETGLSSCTLISSSLV